MSAWGSLSILSGVLHVHRAPELEPVPPLRGRDHVAPVWGPVLLSPSGHIHVDAHPSSRLSAFCSPISLGASFSHRVALVGHSLPQSSSPSSMYFSFGLTSMRYSMTLHLWSPRVPMPSRSNWLPSSFGPARCPSLWFSSFPLFIARYWRVVISGLEPVSAPMFSLEKNFRSKLLGKKPSHRGKT